MPPDVDDKYVSIHGIDITIQKLLRFGPGFVEHLKSVVDAAMDEDVWGEWITEISLEDHTLAELAALGYPYSTRYAPNSFVHPDTQVHIQSGMLKDSSSIETEDLSGEYVKQLLVTAPHYKYLRFGTSIMRMRDPAGAALARALPKIRQRFREEVKAGIVKFFVR